MAKTAYKYVKAPKEYPGYVRDDGQVAEHRLVWWENTGEIPEENEVIHHINEDKRDNRFSNLDVMDETEHISMHNSKGDSVYADEDELWEYLIDLIDEEPRLLNELYEVIDIERDLSLDQIRYQLTKMYEEGLINMKNAHGKSSTLIYWRD